MATDTAAHGAITLTVHGASASDADRGVARLNPDDLRRIGAQVGDIVALTGARTTYARALPARNDERGAARVALDTTQRANAGVGLGDGVGVAAVEIAPARTVQLTSEAAAGGARLIAYLADRPVCVDDAITAQLPDGRRFSGTVAATTPDGPVLVRADTEIVMDVSDAGRGDGAQAAPYPGVGGLADQIAAVGEMVELPLTQPEVFTRLGVSPPRGVLFTGPPGTGKTLLARAVAEKTSAAFFHISGPEIVSKHYGDSEAKLREVFAAAEKRSPAVVFIDEIDAIAPRRADMAGDRQVERRMVAQLLTLLDGLSDRGQVVVMAATNLPDALDPALRRPGRFDREIAFGPPDVAARTEILGVHTREMPLGPDVDLSAVAAVAHGYVGADLAALAREAALAALRRAQSASGGLDVEALSVSAADFHAALGLVRPTAIRDVFVERPKVSWSDVAGLDTVKDALVEAVIWPLRHGAAFRAAGVAPPKGVVLAGPPGCGKTLLARALAAESQVNFIAVRGAQLLSRYVGDAERAVRNTFAKARAAAPCIVFFDELDALAPKRLSEDSGVTVRVVAQLLAEIDGVEELRGVFVLAATNRLEAIDPALIRPGRFDRVFTLEVPDAAARADILAVHVRPMPLADDVDIAQLAAETAGASGAELKALCHGAGLAAVRRAISCVGALGGEETQHSVHVTAADFAAAMAGLRRPSSLSGPGGA